MRNNDLIGTHVFVVMMFTDDSEECKLVGVFANREDAIRTIEEKIAEDPYFDEDSSFDQKAGVAESDPNNCYEGFHIYRIMEETIR